MKSKEPPLFKDHGNGVTQRQAEILELLARGCTDKEMAGTLGVSEETVGHHLRVLYRHHGVHCRAALVAKAAMSANLVWRCKARRTTYTNV